MFTGPEFLGINTIWKKKKKEKNPLFVLHMMTKYAGLWMMPAGGDDAMTF